MDRSLTNQTPDLSNADSALQDRILAGHQAVLAQVEYFRANFGTAEEQLEKRRYPCHCSRRNHFKRIIPPASEGIPEWWFLFGRRSWNSWTNSNQVWILLDSRSGWWDQQLCRWRSWMLHFTRPSSTWNASLWIDIRLWSGQSASRWKGVWINWRNQSCTSSHSVSEWKTDLLHALPHTSPIPWSPETSPGCLAYPLSRIRRNRLSQCGNRATGWMPWISG